MVRSAVTAVTGQRHSEPTSAARHQLTTSDSMAVRCAKSELPQSPRLVGWRGCHECTSSDHFPVELIHFIDVPVDEVRVVSQLACRFLVRALAEHHAETIPRQKAPALSVDRVSGEAEHVRVVLCGRRQVAHRQNTSGIDNASHVVALFRLRSKQSVASSTRLGWLGSPAKFNRTDPSPIVRCAADAQPASR
jgi:hypothetical protein